MQREHPVLVIYGPTASGKSALAMRVAACRPAVIINADAMQCYDGLRILTARPSEAEEAQYAHALYGVWQPHQHGNVAQWIGAVVPIIRQCWAEGKLPVLVGGTGMYLKSLMEGLSDVPAIDDAVRTGLNAMTAAERYAALQRDDAVMAARLKPGDTQRIFRALEVMRATGQSLSVWQARGATPVLPEAQFYPVVVDVPRAQLYAQIDARFLTMLDMGALDEARNFINAHGSGTTPIFKAHGLPEFGAYFKGDMALEDAIAKGQQNTRNYAKRQMTWARGQLPHAVMLAPDIPAETLLSQMS